MCFVLLALALTLFRLNPGRLGEGYFLADWFKFYENGLDEDRLQWAMTEHREVLDVWLRILSGCCRTKSDSIGWTGSDDELLGMAHKLHTSIGKVNECIKLLARIRYIEMTETRITVRKWTEMQSDYMRRKQKRNVKKCTDTVRTETETGRPEEKRREKELLFNEFWAVYPKKQGKAKARAVYLKLNGKITHQALLEAVERQKAYGGLLAREKQFIPMPQTYLTGERWLDEADAADKKKAPDFI